MDYRHFKITIVNHVCSISFNRPSKSNSLNREAWIEMKRIFDDFSDRNEVRVIILEGEGNNFCAGIDLALLMDINQIESNSCEGRKREELRKFIFFLQDCISSIERCRKPVIASIHGACIGGGVDIISACDLRFSTNSAFFSIKEIDMGLVADIGTLQRLPKIIPYAQVVEMALTGRKVTGVEAKEIGLVNRVYESRDELNAQVMKLAKVIAAKSPIVVRGTKEILQYTRDHSVNDSLNYMATYNAAFLLTNDLKESFEAQMSKRAPIFKD